MREILRRIGLWFCRHGWHGKITYTAWDGCSFHAKCERCGFVGLIDSHGDLSLTPASVAQRTEDARVGRTVREFVTRQKTADYYRRTTSDYERGYKDAVDAVEIAIAKAREGKADG